MGFFLGGGGGWWGEGGIFFMLASKLSMSSNQQGLIRYVLKMSEKRPYVEKYCAVRFTKRLSNFGVS